jgi:hypothetical protein
METSKSFPLQTGAILFGIVSNVQAERQDTIIPSNNHVFAFSSAVTLTLHF